MLFFSDAYTVAAAETWNESERKQLAVGLEEMALSLVNITLNGRKMNMVIRKQIRELLTEVCIDIWY